VSAAGEAEARRARRRAIPQRAADATPRSTKVQAEDRVSAAGEAEAAGIAP